MNYRQLGASGLEISEIGYGAWGVGGWDAHPDDQESMRAIDAALELGVNFFDTAPVYGEGHSEDLLGRVLANRRDQVLIATKIPPKTMRWPLLPEDPIAATFPADWIVQCTEKSLKRLRSDYLDLQQLHAWTPGYLEEQGWLDTLAKLKDSGKIRAIGVSLNEWDPDSGLTLAQSGVVDSIAVTYNIFDQRAKETLFPACHEQGVGVVVRTPFEEGLLVGSIVPGHNFTRGDWRKEWLDPERITEAYERSERLKEFLDADTPDLPTLALRFCLSHPAVSTVIPGMRRVRHVHANLAASDAGPLPAETVDALKQHVFVHGWARPWAKRAP